MLPLNQNDLLNLNTDFYSTLSSFYFIFGKNNGGKTTFIQDFLVKKNHLYLSGFPANAKILFSACIQQINIKYKIKHTSRFYETFESLLWLIHEVEYKEKKLIVFDNIQEFLKVDKNTLKSLALYWNKYFKNSNTMIVCLINNYKEKPFIDKLPIKQIHLTEFSFHFLQNKPSLSPTDKFYLYSIFGSSKHFYNYYNNKQELTKNVYQLAFQPGSPFYNYGFEYLKKDFTEIGTFCAILYAISIGNNKIGEIAQEIGLDSSYLTRYIKKLCDYMIISKTLPLTSKQKYPKYGRYFINDNFLHFWFCFVYPNRISLEIKRTAHVLRDLDTHIKSRIITPNYKRFIHTLIQSNPIKYLGFEPKCFGSWWDNNGNFIDLVAFDSEQIFFINILWDTIENTMEQKENLIKMSKIFHSTLKRNYIMISKNTYLNNWKDYE